MRGHWPAAPPAPSRRVPARRTAVRSPRFTHHHQLCGPTGSISRRAAQPDLSRGGEVGLMDHRGRMPTGARRSRSPKRWIDYLANYFGDDAGGRLGRLSSRPISRQHLVKQPLYAETVDASVGTDAAIARPGRIRRSRCGPTLHRLWRQAFVSDRLRYAGGGFALVLAASARCSPISSSTWPPAGAIARRLRWAAGAGDTLSGGRSRRNLRAVSSRRCGGPLANSHRPSTSS